MPVFRPVSEFVAPAGFSRPQEPGVRIGSNVTYFLGNYLAIQVLMLLFFSYFRPVFLLALLVPTGLGFWIHRSKPQLPKEALGGAAGGCALLALMLGGKQMLVWSAVGLVINLAHASFRETVDSTQKPQQQSQKNEEPVVCPKPEVKAPNPVVVSPAAAAAAEPEPEPEPRAAPEPEQLEPEAKQPEPVAAAAAVWTVSAAQESLIQEFEAMEPIPEEIKRKRKADDETVDLNDLKRWVKLISSLLDGNGESYKDGDLELSAQELKEWREKHPDDEERHDLYFKHCRAQAQEHAVKRGECFEQASKAFDSGDKGAAAELSAEGHRQGELFRQANLEAALRLFWSRNAEPDTTRDRPDAEGNLPVAKGNKLTYNGAVDLHALQVAEALAAVQATLVELAKRGHGPGFDVIPGRGSHSVGNKALIQPKVKDWLQARGFQAELDQAGGTIHVTF